LLTQVSALCWGLSQGAALPAEPLPVRSKPLPLLRQVLPRGLPEGLPHLGLCQRVGEELPSTLALERPLRWPLLAGRPQQAATCLATVAF